MAHQQRRREQQQQQRTASSLDDTQLPNMIDQLYETEMNVQSGTFLISSHPNTSPILFSPRSSTTDIITDVSSPPPPSTSTSVSRKPTKADDEQSSDDNSSWEKLEKLLHNKAFGPILTPQNETALGK
jgi:hypothetical protein